MFSYLRRWPRGFNLIEAAIVLGVIGLIIGGIWVAASTIRENNHVQTVARAIQLGQQNINTLFKGQSYPTYTDFTSQCVPMNIFSSILQSSGGLCLAPFESWNQYVSVAIEGQHIYFWVRYNSPSICIKLTRAVAVGENYSLHQIRYSNSSYVTHATISDPTSAAAYQAAQTHCIENGGVGFIFRRQ